MASIPNLYLKWRVLKELIGLSLSDAQIGAMIFGEGKDGAQKFSKLLYGDYGCPPEIGGEMVAIINRRLENYRKSRGLAPASGDPFKIADLELPFYVFTRKLIATAEATDDEALDRTQDALLKELTPTPSPEGGARLVVECYEKDRFIGSRPSGGSGPVTLHAGRHKGRLAVLGVDREPTMAYTVLVRDPRPGGYRSWDLHWGETVLWMPSPSTPRLLEGTLLLMPEATAMRPDPGRFLATTVLVWETSVQRDLDPRGTTAEPGDLDELETSRFFTNLRRIAKRKPTALSVTTAAYIVEV